MRTGWLFVLGGLLLLRRAAGAATAPPPARVDLRCDPDPDNPWGRSWGAERPPDLPWGGRRPCERWSGRSLVERMARRQGLGEAFVRTVVHLAETESEATPGLPARRPYGSAAGWGAFQFNQGAWRALGRRRHGCEAPMPGAASMDAWEATVTEEIAGPIAMYACLWRNVTVRGGDALDAARGVRLWHTGSAYFGTYLGRAEALGSFRAAWSDLQEDPPNPRFADMLARTDGRMGELGLL